jgi:2,4-dienoyl-CoA reductase (NADPH2)
VETIKKVRAAVGDDYTVTIRVAGNDFVRGGNTNEDSAQFCQLFEKAGADGINVTGGWHEAFVSQLTMEVPRGGYAYLAGGIRNAVNVPVIASNRITDPRTAERILGEGLADMVALGRVLVADPDWPKKSQTGRAEEIRPCVGCMQGCMDRIFTGQPLCCLVNAEAGLEEERDIKPAEQPKKIVVVGSGPGGLEAARVAAKAGHQVELFEKAPRIGGQLAVAGAPPGRGEFLGLVDYYEAVLPALGVKVHTGKELDIDRIKTMNPEALIVAEGAEPIIPNIPGADLPHVISSWEFLKDIPAVGKRVAVIGGGAVGMEVAMQAARIGTINPNILEFLMFHRAETDERLHDLVRKGTKEVTIFEMLPKPGQDVGKSSRWVWLHDLREREVRIVTRAKVEAIEPDGVLYTVEGETKKEPFDSVIMAVGSRPKKTLSEKLEQAGIPFRAVGDCNTPRMIIDAVHEGYLAAVDI